jgi:hypothetical protein
LCTRLPRGWALRGAPKGRCAPAFHHSHTKHTDMCERRMSSHLCVLARPWGRSGGAVRPPSTTVTPNSQKCVKDQDPLTLCTRMPRRALRGALCAHLPPPPNQTRRHVVKEQDHLTVCTRMPRMALRGRCAPAFHHSHTKHADMCERRRSSHTVCLHAQGGAQGALCAPPSTTSKTNSHTCCERAGSSQFVDAHAQGGAQGALCIPTFHHLQTKLAYML